MKKNGFTLIELLVTMGIIAVLTGMAVFNFNQSRMRARDVSRKSDLSQLVKAMELFKIDTGTYPDPLDGDFQEQLFDAGYTKVTFVDPKGSDWNTVTDISPSGTDMYQYNLVDGKTYYLMACLENASDNVRALADQCQNFNNFQGPSRECWCGTDFAGRMYVVSNP